MSKADTLGPAPTFSAVRSARRNAIDRIGGKDATAAITELAVTLISENPDNPRNHLRNLDETTESVREVGIILPIVVATTEAYLRDRPDRANDLDEGAQYVVVDGHRRLEASRRVGLATIPVRVDNARVATDESLLEAAFVANYHRDGMTDLEEAHALKQLVDYYGSQTKAAKRLGIPQGTISSKLSLLKLTPDLQKDLVTGTRKVEHVRNLGKLSPEEQRAKADERAEAASRKAEEASGPATERPSGPADYHGVIITESEPDPQPAPSTARSQPAADYHGVIIPNDAAIPEPRHVPAPALAPQPTATAPAPGREPETKPIRTFPYDDPYMSAQLCWKKMDRETYLAHIRNVMHMLREERPEDFRELASDLDV